MSITIPAVGREVHLVARPVGEPTKAEFALVDASVVPPVADQALVRNEWFSVDPCMRSRMNDVKSYVPPFAVGAPMDGGAVGTVSRLMRPPSRLARRSFTTSAGVSTRRWPRRPFECLTRRRRPRRPTWVCSE